MTTERLAIFLKDPSCARLSVDIRVHRARLWSTPEGWLRLQAVFRCQVSGVSNRIRPAVSESLMKWTFFHRCWPSVATKSVFRIQDSVFTHMKLQVAGTVKRLNVQHRTSNIEHRILMTLRFIYLIKNERITLKTWSKDRRILNHTLTTSSPPRARTWACRWQPNRISKGSFALLSLFIKLTEYIIRCWTFDVRCSMFIF